VKKLSFLKFVFCISLAIGFVAPQTDLKASDTAAQEGDAAEGALVVYGAPKIPVLSRHLGIILMFLNNVITLPNGRTLTDETTLPFEKLTKFLLWLIQPSDDPICPKHPLTVDHGQVSHKLLLRMIENGALQSRMLNLITTYDLSNTTPKHPFELERLVPLQPTLCSLHVTNNSNLDAQQTCQLISACPSLKDLSLASYWNVTDEEKQGFQTIMQVLQSLQHLQKVYFFDCTLTDPMVQQLLSCQKLQDVSIEFCIVPNGTIAQLSQCPELTHLVLNNVDNLTSIEIHSPTITSATVSTCQHLANLDLSHCPRLSHMPGDGLQSCPVLTVKLEKCTSLTKVSFPNHPSLEVIELTGCAKLASLDVSGCLQLDTPRQQTKTTGSLNRCPLQFVDFSGCPNVDNESVRLLVTCCQTTLEVAKFNGCQGLTDTAAEFLGLCSQLTSLSLAYCNGLTSRSVDVLRKCFQTKELKALSFDFCNGITAVDLSHCDTIFSGTLNSLPNAQSIDYSNCPNLQTITISDCPNLTQLDLSACPHLHTLYVQNCSSLTQLNLTNSSNLYIATINNCPQLTQLNLSACPHLHTVTIQNCPNITDTTVQQVVEKAINLQVACFTGSSQITNASIQLLLSCSEINYIDFSLNANITPTALELLAQHPTLTKVVLLACPQITKDATALALSQRPPKYPLLQVIIVPPPPPHIPQRGDLTK
jgi:hypothetical protein